jgi:succinyl-CoA synthetase beta subunit
VGKACQALQQNLRRLRGTLTEYESRTILAEFGISLGPHLLVRTRDELANATSQVCCPLAAKIQSRDIPHKTEAGGVRLNIADSAALNAAYDAILAAVAAHKPDARIDGILLAPMAPPGIEMIVGVVRDPLFGPVLMVGAGGMAAELFNDACFRLAPVSEPEALDMISSLRSKPLLEGFRGIPCADVPALATLMAQLSAFASSFQDSVREVELNPVIVHAHGKGCTIADALLTLDPEQGA